MGAIFGFHSSQSDYSPSEALHHMSKTLFHRGPHHHSFFASDTFGLGFRALRSETFYRCDILQNPGEEILLALDATLSNYTQCQGSRPNPSTHTTPVTFDALRQIYIDDGLDFISTLNGAFSLALLDRPRGFLVLARDQAGQKPLYYSHSHSYFAFASELKALSTLPYFEKKLDLNGLLWYLATGYITSPRSIFKNIYKLSESNILLYDFRNRTIKHIPFIPRKTRIFPSRHVSEVNLIQSFDEIFTTVIEEYVSKTPEPIGCFLSGGIDTSLLLAILKKVTNKRIVTFTVGFDDPLCDERPYARRIARFFNVDNCEYVMTECDFVNATHKITDLFHEPFSDIGLATALHASHLAKAHTENIFSGDGADFLFGNYDFKYLYLYYRIIPILFRKFFIFLSDPLFNNSFIKRRFPNMPIQGYLGEKTFFEAFFIKWKRHELETLFGFDVDARDGKFFKVFSNSTRRYLSDRILEAQYKTYGIDCVDTKSERANMANSLHVINPYLDNRVIEFAQSLPIHLKYRKGYGKYLNRKLLYKYIPREYFDRPKRGSGVPFGDLTSRGVEMLIRRYLRPERLRGEGIFKDISPIDQAIKSYLSGDHFNGHKLWTLIVFEIWLERNRCVV